MVIKKGVEVSRLSGAESVVGQRGKFECHALHNRKPMKIFEDTIMNVCLVGERDWQQPWQVCSGHAVAD